MSTDIRTSKSPFNGQSDASKPTVVIQPSKRWAPLRLSELWDYRELFTTLAMRDLRVRYKQTELGLAWAVIQPFMMMVVFTLIFGRIGQVGSYELPYPVFSYVGLLPWTYFSGSIAASSNSLVVSSSLITKVYFPRLILPASSLVAGLADLAIAMVFLFGIMLVYGVTPTIWILLLPLFVLLAMLTALGVGLWLSALNVEYRDVKYVVPFLVQLWLFITPVIYPITQIPEKLRLLYALNPMVGVIQGFHWAIHGRVSFPGFELGMSLAVSTVLLVTGIFYFRRMERGFADVV